jgi:hypothetical protein
MAIFRLNRGQWETGYATVPVRVQRKAKATAQPKDSRQRKSVGAEDAARKRTDASSQAKTRSKGVSSGLSTVVRRQTKGKWGTGGTKVKWWNELAGTGDGPKGRIVASLPT